VGFTINIAGCSFRQGQPKPVSGIESSVGSIGTATTIALAETINGFYKAEVIHRRGPCRSFEVVELATLEWVDWFNNRRLLEPIGNIPPAEAERHYYATLDHQPSQRDLNETASGKPGRFKPPHGRDQDRQTTCGGEFASLGP
jgi:hypothetical protein